MTNSNQTPKLESLETLQAKIDTHMDRFACLRQRLVANQRRIAQLKSTDLLLA